jgi:hypothetical protein
VGWDEVRNPVTHIFDPRWVSAHASTEPTSNPFILPTFCLIRPCIQILNRQVHQLPPLGRVLAIKKFVTLILLSQEQSLKRRMTNKIISNWSWIMKNNMELQIEWLLALILLAITGLSLNMPVHADSLYIGDGVTIR